MLSFLKPPKLSQPLTKAIRTLEGVTSFLITVGLAVTTGIDPSKLPTKEAAWLIAANNGLLLAQRTVLKGIALTKGLGVAAPVQFEPFPATAAGEVAGELGPALADLINAGQHAATILNSRPESGVKADLEPAKAVATAGDPPLPASEG